MKKERIRSICDLLMGMLVLTASVAGYAGHPDCMGEYCFVSGITTGIVFISSFIYRIRSGKSFSEWVYAACSVITMMILIATMILGLKLSGAFIFIHLIDPLLMFAYWAYFCDHNKTKKIINVLTVLIFPVFYTVLSGALMKITGNCPFPASLVLTGHTPPVTAGIVAGVYMLFLLLGCGYYFGNKSIRSKLIKPDRDI